MSINKCCGYVCVSVSVGFRTMKIFPKKPVVRFRTMKTLPKKAGPVQRYVQATDFSENVVIFLINV